MPNETFNCSDSKRGTDADWDKSQQEEVFKISEGSWLYTKCLWSHKIHLLKLVSRGETFGENNGQMRS